MVRTTSTMLPLGTSLPSFELPVVQGTCFQSSASQKQLDRISSRFFQSKPLLIMILCAHCPFVKHIESELTKLGRDYLDEVDFLAIASNSLITHPQDGPEHLLAQAIEQGWRFPYLLDSDQSFAKALQASCTPDFFLFSPNSKGHQMLNYRGQLDGSRPGNQVPVTGVDLRIAIQTVLKNEKVFVNQKPSIGCNIKWNPGNEPFWFD